MLSSIVDATAAKLRDPKTLYLLELKNMPPEGSVLPVVLHGAELGLDARVLSHKLPQYGTTEPDKNVVACSYFFSKSKRTSFSSIEVSIGDRTICYIFVHKFSVLVTSFVG